MNYGNITQHVIIVYVRDWEKSERSYYNCTFLCLSSYLSCLVFFVSVCLSVFFRVCVSVYLSVLLFVCLPVRFLSFDPYIYLSVFLSLCLSVVILSFDPLIYLFVCLSWLLSFWPINNWCFMLKHVSHIFSAKTTPLCSEKMWLIVQIRLINLSLSSQRVRLLSE